MKNNMKKELEYKKVKKANNSENLKKEGIKKEKVRKPLLQKEESLERKKNSKNSLKERALLKKSKKGSKKETTKKLSFGILDLFIVVVVVSIISCVSTGFFLNYQYKKATAKYLSSLETDGNLAEMIKVYNDINNNYYENIDKDALMDAAIDGMLNFLKDKYSIYLNNDETDDLTDSLNGTYEGVGISLLGQKIIDVYPNSPAEDAGLADGDLIVKVNDQEITDNNVGLLADLINVKNAESVTLSIKRNDIVSTYKLNFEKVSITVVESNYFDYSNKKIGYIKIKSFSNNAYEQFFEKLRELENKKIDSLIIDLRNNGGGYLSSATELAELFLSKGKIIYTLDKKSGKEVIKDKSDEKRDYTVAILIDGGTASAAEVLASSLKDNRENTILIGTQSFGKGTVQSTKRLSDGSMLKYTIAKWLRPNGECVEGVGLKPDYVIENLISNDKQLEKALDLLK